MAATSENGERILTVNYNSGERLLRVPQGTSITYIEPDGSTAMPLIKPGCNIAIFTRFSDGNRETEQAITLAKSDIRTAPTLSVHRPPTRPKG